MKEFTDKAKSSLKVSQDYSPYAMAAALISIAESFDKLIEEMDNSKCGHGVVTLFGECSFCRTMNGGS